jgi:hypothetical protein
MKEWDGNDRPKGWQGHEHGLAVHTTGSGLTARALKEGVYPTVMAERHYSASHGCHYVNGFRGHEGGDLIQMANESEQANGIGVSEQRNKKTGEVTQRGQKESIRGKYSGAWDTDLPKTLAARWKERWPEYENPLDLLPGTTSANPCYIHMECIPLNAEYIAQGYVPAFKGSSFTMWQYRTIAALSLDIATRKAWAYEWWRTTQLLGHEDLTPISRHIKSGAWDPGALLASPRFRWSEVISHLGELMGEDIEESKLPKTRRGGKYVTRRPRRR